MVGEVIGGRYRLEELAGAGGMSSVYRAHDTVLERDVALKILHQHHTEDEEYVERFRREARVVAQLAHPNIVTVIDRGEEEERQFIVFEYVEGQTLKEFLDAEGRLSVPRALEVTIEVARGLAFAHEHGLVHRDVKPQNVILNGDGEAKVTDFGIARSLDVEGVTQSGTVLGTSNYISPEQATGRPVDAKTDVYSLGVVLFELLTGELPFPGESFVAVAMRHVHEPPPNVLDKRPEVPARVALAVERALEKEPDERFSSMGELADELEACLFQLRGEAAEEDTLVGAPLRSVRRGGVRRRWVGLPAALLLGAAALLTAAVVAVVLTRGADGLQPPLPGSDGEPAPEAIRLSGVGAYDPQGGDGEHDADAPLATDGDPGTDWATERYSSFQKDGVGLVLDAGRPVSPSRLVVETSAPGFRAEIQAGPRPDGGFRRVSPNRLVGATTPFPIRDGTEARYFLVWITEPNGRARVNEVRAR